MSVIKYPVFLVSLVVSLGAHSEFVSSKKPDNVMTIKAALELKDKDHVVIVGRIIKEFSREKFLVADSTGEVCVEINKEIMPTEKFDETNDLKISGEIDKDFKLNGDKCEKFKIDAKSVEILKSK
ncbi:YgiW/YdeI family stress tolerance OB fold protein [Fluviispira vulneris]|uniref:YgiW/YdeI family stress tolerance OB fold protein n=1 Tax=Fluviispira vulneris TaxID=2763012 RepID=UPI0016495EA7|nr:NirD/YgiW/YdeI family stress tolerance protein [Fluviispira vulneris]